MSLQAAMAEGDAVWRRWAPLYLHGLLGPDGRKSLQPLAARLGLGGRDQLQHFIASPAWDDAPLRRVLIEKADALVGGPGAVLVIDDTACPKQGRLGSAAAKRSAWPGSTAVPWASGPTAKSWSR